MFLTSFKVYFVFGHAYFMCTCFEAAIWLFWIFWGNVWLFLVKTGWHLATLSFSPSLSLVAFYGQDQGCTKGGVGVNPPLSLIFCKNFIIRRVYRAWFFTKIKGVCVEEYAYDVNKLRLKTWIWRQIVTS